MKTNRIFEKIDKLINFVEKERLGILGVFILVSIIISVRTFLEASLSPSWRKFYGAFFYAHTMAFYVPQFLGMLLLLKIFTGEKLIKLANLASLGFIITIFPPIYDFVICNRKYGYAYMSYEKIPKMLTSFYLKYPSQFHQLSNGQVLQFIILFTLATIYMIFKTKSLIKSITFPIIIYFGAPLTAFPTLNPFLAKLNEIKATTNYPLAVESVLYLFNYILVSAIISLLILFVIYKRKIINIFKSMRLMPTAHFLLMVIIGIIIANQINMIKVFSMPWEVETGLVGIALFSTFLLWQYAVWINHVYDYEIDQITAKERALPQGILNVKAVKETAFVLCIISISLSFLLGYAFFMAILAAFLAYIYSCPPFRLRNTIFSSLFIGAGSMMAFFYGYFVPSPSMIRYEWFIYSTIPNMETIFIGILIFVILSVGSTIKDIKDYEGDRKAGVKNIFTVFGIEKGTKIATVLIFLAINMPLLIIHDLIDFIFLPFYALLTSLYFLKKKNFQLTFLLYMIGLLYCLVRWMKIL